MGEAYFDEYEAEVTEARFEQEKAEALDLLRAETRAFLLVVPAEGVSALNSETADEEGGRRVSAAIRARMCGVGDPYGLFGLLVGSLQVISDNTQQIAARLGIYAAQILPRKEGS